MSGAFTKVQVYVRAKMPDGKRVACHVNDLTEQSFRDFVMQVMVDRGMVVGIKTDEVPVYYTRADYVEAKDELE